MWNWNSASRALTSAITGAFLMGLAQAAIADATVEGTITDAGSGAPIGGATVVISDRSGHEEFSGVTDGFGNYLITVPLGVDETRDIIIEAAGPQHAPARHNFAGDLPCFFNCGDGGEITVAPGDMVTADIALQPGGTISGTITNAATGDPLPDAFARQIDADSGFGFSPHFHGVADSNGNYTTPLATAPGDRFIVAEAAPVDNFAARAWQDLPCEHGSCPIRDTDPVPITAGGQVSGIDFALEPGASISGTLLPDINFRIVSLYNGAGINVDVLFLFSGAEWSFDQLSGGGYYVQLGASGFVRILQNGLLCPFGGCIRARGEPVNVPAGSSVTLDPIELSESGQIGGTLVDAATGDPIPVEPGSRFGTYDIIDGSGEVVGGGLIMEDGGNAALLPSSNGVPAGDYFVRTYQNWFGQGIGYTHPGFGDDTLPGYTDAVHPNIPCAGLDCDLAAATPVTVTAGTTQSITIGISTGSNITGSVVDDATGAPIESAVIKLVDASNRLLASTRTDEFGMFSFGAFPEGTYYLRTAMSAELGPGVFPDQHAYFDKVYGAMNNCSEQLCDPTTGTQISLDGSNDAGPFDLRVESGPVIFGQIVDELTGLPIPNGRVEVFNAAGELVGAYGINRSTAEYRTTALAPGDYTMEPFVSPAFSEVSFSSSSSPSSQTVYRPEAVTGATTLKVINESDGPIAVTVGTEDVEVNLQVVDTVRDVIFKSSFEIQD